MPRYNIRTISTNPATWIRQGIRRYLNECKARARDLRPIWPTALAILQENMAEVFDSEGAVDGQPRWAQNSRRPIHFHGKVTRTFSLGGGRTTTMTYNPSYAQWKALNYPGKKIMELTGKLRQQLTDGGDPSRYVRMTRKALIFGTNYTDYSRVPDRPRSGRDRLTGDLGGILNAGREDYYPMPAREIFRVTDVNIGRIGDVALDYIMGSHP